MVCGEGEQHVVSSSTGCLEVATQQLPVEPLQSIEIAAAHPGRCTGRVGRKLGNGLVAELLPGPTGDLLVAIRKMCPPVMDEYETVRSSRST